MTEHYMMGSKSISEIMDKDVLFIEESSSIEDTIRKMLINSKSEAIIVSDYDDRTNLENILGVVTFKCMSKFINQNMNFEEEIGKWVNKNIVTIEIGESTRTAKFLMRHNAVERLMVLKNGNIVGVLSPLEMFKHQDIEQNEIELQLRIILGNLHEAVCVVNNSGIVTFWNARSEKLYDIKKEDIVGVHIGKFFPNALILKALNEKKVFENIKHQPKIGSDVIISAIPLIYNNQIIGVVSTDRDVNEITNLYMELDREKTRVEILRQQMMEITQDKYIFGNIIGKSKVLTDAMRLAKQVARTDASVLITGESGTGKEVFSRAIHEESGRQGNFIPINCSAIPTNLLESELFGYVEGAFTGAYKKGRAGKFELANGGTLFLDEIGDMPLLMQAKLLRVLQDGIVYRVGSEKPIKVDARIIAATNKDLEELMEEGNFREDLYYRLNVVSILIPPLRDRKEDIPELIKTFIAEFSKKNNMDNFYISIDAMKMLADHNWKGNIRELRNTIEGLVILSKNNRIEAKDIPNEIKININSDSLIDINGKDDFDLKKTVENFEKNLIMSALKSSNGNKVQAAEILKVKRATLYYKLNLYNLNEYITES